MHLVQLLHGVFRQAEAKGLKKRVRPLHNRQDNAHVAIAQPIEADFSATAIVLDNCWAKLPFGFELSLRNHRLLVKGVAFELVQFQLFSHVFGFDVKLRACQSKIILVSALSDRKTLSRGAWGQTSLE